MHEFSLFEGFVEPHIPLSASDFTHDPLCATLPQNVLTYSSLLVISGRYKQGA